MPENTVAAFGDIASATLSDAMDRFGVLEGIHPLWAGATLAGPAFTVWTRAGDNKGLHTAFETIRRGDILVVNGGGDVTRALIGELVAEKAKALAIGGIVLDGAARDIVGLEEIGVPVFARAVTPSGPYKNGPFRVGVPIAVGGVSVAPGDYIIGDADGVVCVPRAEAEATVLRALELLEGEKVRLDANRQLVPRG